MHLLILIFFWWFGFLAKDETISGFVAPDTQWFLHEISGQPYDAQAWLSFPETGEITGQGPCNGFSATQVVPYPWFEITGLSATKMACPDLPQEHAFFDGLANARFVEVTGSTLILSNDTGASLVFESRPSEGGAD